MHLSEVLNMSETKESSTVIGPALEGVGYVFSAPARLPLVRTVLKEAIKVGLRTSRTLQGFAFEQTRQWMELVTEARTEAEAAEAQERVKSESSASEASSAAETEEHDLQSLDGVGPPTAELLREAGVRSKRALARRNAENLHEKLAEINEQKSIAGSVPSVEQIQAWIDSV